MFPGSPWPVYKVYQGRTGSRGQCWQGRYASQLLDEQYLIACARYIEINPVKREYVDQPEDWPWRSAQAHIMKKEDPLVQTKPLLGRVDRKWRDFLAETRPVEEADLFYLHEKNGRPLVALGPFIMGKETVLYNFSSRFESRM